MYHSTVVARPSHNSVLGLQPIIFSVIVISADRTISCGLASIAPSTGIRDGSTRWNNLSTGSRIVTSEPEPMSKVTTPRFVLIAVAVKMPGAVGGCVSAVTGVFISVWICE